MIRSPIAWLIAATMLAAIDVHAAPRRRALLVGINDYSASRLGARMRVGPFAGRDWVDLSGAVNDVRAMRAMLVQVYGFNERDIVVLEDQCATRAAILRTLETHLIRPAANGDTILFYFAGHGSQVRNALSDEPDKMDESLVPADSRVGAWDIRDKELRAAFNRILDRGALLTVVIDSCHSGSGARDARGVRTVKPDLRDAADPATGPRPEDRGALVLAAAQDFEFASELPDERGAIRGAFSSALLWAMREAAAGEPAEDTFLRAHARLRPVRPHQHPVLAGDERARTHPLLGTRKDRRGDRIVVAVQEVRGDGTVVIDGGWANGLTVGSELRAATPPLRLIVTAIRGLGRSEARVVSTSRAKSAMSPGALLEVTGWAAAPAPPLRLRMPRTRRTAAAIAQFAQTLAAASAQRNVRWTTEPSEATHVLRRRGAEWELVTATSSQHVGPLAMGGIAKVPSGATLFVQLPAPVALVLAIDVGRGSGRDVVEPTTDALDADVALVGRFAGGRLQYAWLRERESPLPRQTRWLDADDATLADVALELRGRVLRLRRVQAWHLLESPPGTAATYRLALRKLRDGARVGDGTLVAGETYGLTLHRGRAPVAQRFIYVFALDGDGRSVLLFPRSSVENRFPLDPRAPPPEIAIDGVTFEPVPPFGVDTFFLLTTDEPLPNPSILAWDGVRVRAPSTRSPLEELLLSPESPRRSARVLTPANWSIEKVVFESVEHRRITP